MKKILLFSIIGLLAFFACNTQKSLITTSIIKPDSTIVKFYGKEISDVIFLPEKVKVYKIRPNSQSYDLLKADGNHY